MDILALYLGEKPFGKIMKEDDIALLFPQSRFEEPDRDQSNGFYDFLRRSEELIVGIRWYPFPTAEYVLNHVKESSLIHADTSGTIKVLTIWLGRQEEFKNEISGDQQFYWNRIFVEKQTTSIAITFGIDRLSRKELDGVEERLNAFH